MNTIGDMQNEMDFYDHCKKFEHNHDFVIFFGKNDDALLEYDVLDSEVYLLFRMNNFTIYKIVSIINCNIITL